LLDTDHIDQKGLLEMSVILYALDVPYTMQLTDTLDSAHSSTQLYSDISQ